MKFKYVLVLEKSLIFLSFVSVFFLFYSTDYVLALNSPGTCICPVSSSSTSGANCYIDEDCSICEKCVGVDLSNPNKPVPGKCTPFACPSGVNAKQHFCGDNDLYSTASCCVNTFYQHYCEYTKQSFCKDCEGVCCEGEIESTCCSKDSVCYEGKCYLWSELSYCGRVCVKDTLIRPSAPCPELYRQYCDMYCYGICGESPYCICKSDTLACCSADKICQGGSCVATPSCTVTAWGCTDSVASYPARCDLHISLLLFKK